MPEPSLSERQKHWRTLRTLSNHLWPSGRLDLKTRVCLALICMAVAKAINVYIPFLYKGAVDQLSLEQAVLVLPLTFILAYGGARVLNQVFGEMRDFIFVKVSQHAQRTIALSTFQHLHQLSLSFHLERQTGGLSRVIERGTSGIQFLLNFMLFNILPTLIEIGMVTTVLFIQFDYRFSLITVGTIGGYIAFTLITTEWRLKFRKTMNEKDSEANTKAIDSLLNYETVKYFGNEGHEYKRFDQALEGFENAAVKSQTSLSYLNVGQGLIIGAGLVAIMLLTAQGVVSGEYTIGDFVLVNTFLIQLYLPLNFLGFVYREIKRSLVDMDKMFDLLDKNAEVKDRPNATPIQVEKGAIHFKNVSFGYHPERQILKGIDFSVPAGNTVAIVGPSGAGKSTISRLLFRFYDVQKGSISIDGQDIREVTQASFRSEIGVVPQDTVLFNDSIAYNIEYGLPNSSKTEVENAARMAKIHDFITKLPEGYETVVGERGLKLSGGEKQRVAIARTILKRPHILLFDEATSALDSHTEKEIQQSLREVSKDHTTLIIAHRLSTIVHADEILVLKEGLVAERGTHEELMALNGEYSEMWAKQQHSENGDSES